jgi:hypothetical protein
MVALAFSKVALVPYLCASCLLRELNITLLLWDWLSTFCIGLNTIPTLATLGPVNEEQNPG